MPKAHPALVRVGNWEMRQVGPRVRVVGTAVHAVTAALGRHTSIIHRATSDIDQVRELLTSVGLLLAVALAAAVAYRILKLRHTPRLQVLTIENCTGDPALGEMLGGLTQLSRDRLCRSLDWITNPHDLSEQKVGDPNRKLPTPRGKEAFDEVAAFESVLSQGGVGTATRALLLLTRPQAGTMVTTHAMCDGSQASLVVTVSDLQGGDPVTRTWGEPPQPPVGLPPSATTISSQTSAELAKARGHEIAGSFAAALDCYVEAINQHPGLKTAREGLARCAQAMRPAGPRLEALVDPAFRWAGIEVARREIPRQLQRRWGGGPSAETLARVENQIGLLFQREAFDLQDTFPALAGQLYRAAFASYERAESKEPGWQIPRLNRADGLYLMASAGGAVAGGREAVDTAWHDAARLYREVKRETFGHNDLTTGWHRAVLGYAAVSFYRTDPGHARRAEAIEEITDMLPRRWRLGLERDLVYLNDLACFYGTAKSHWEDAFAQVRSDISPESLRGAGVTSLVASVLRDVTPETLDWIAEDVELQPLCGDGAQERHAFVSKLRELVEEAQWAEPKIRTLVGNEFEKRVHTLVAELEPTLKTHLWWWGYGPPT